MQKILNDADRFFNSLPNGGIMKLGMLVGGYTFSCPKCSSVYKSDSLPEGNCPDCGMIIQAQYEANEQ